MIVRTSTLLCGLTLLGSTGCIVAPRPGIVPANQVRFARVQYVGDDPVDRRDDRQVVVAAEEPDLVEEEPVLVVTPRPITTTVFADCGPRRVYTRRYGRTYPRRTYRPRRAYRRGRTVRRGSYRSGRSYRRGRTYRRGRSYRSGRTYRRGRRYRSGRTYRRGRRR